ncbi:MAG: 16S rRNA (guanine(527)-N(7))-methyltransferase RsmG [Bacteroidales bacterium]|nr:16S rRNA (guanine(527)-N(7))-methyltransferase RsmG [Bacteroidales bacterium]
MEEILKYFPDLTPWQKERFAAMKALYDDWNSKINVISRKDMDNFYTHHVLHSLAVALIGKTRFEKGDTVLDLGTGGGFPGIPLAVMFPEIQFTLCDSIGKKIKVAENVAAQLELGNVTCVNARAESLGKSFDWVVSRAVTSLDNFLPWIKNSYRKGVVYLKGGDIEDEIDKAAGKRLLNPKNFTIIEISDFFSEEWFKEKKMLIISR